MVHVERQVVAAGLLAGLDHDDRTGAGHVLLLECAERRQAAGLPAEQAKWAAQRNLGNLALLQEETRTAWGWTVLEQLVQDVRYAFRTMASSPAFTLLAVTSLALGIGANTAIYSFMDAILLRSLPVSDPESLVTLNWQGNGQSKEAAFPHNTICV